MEQQSFLGMLVGLLHLFLVCVIIGAGVALGMSFILEINSESKPLSRKIGGFIKSCWGKVFSKEKNSECTGAKPANERQNPDSKG